MVGEGSESPGLQSRTELALWPGILAGLPVLVFGVALILANLQGFKPQGDWAWLLFAADGIVLIGLVIGWIGWFPNWSYAFAGMAVLFSLWWSTSTTGTDRMLSGPLAWSPLLLMLALGVLLTRSFKPVLKFLQGLLRDWSLASLGLYSLLPFAMFAAMSVMPAANAIVFQIPAVLCMAAGAAIAGLVEGSRVRWRVLLLGLSWSWIVVTLGVAIYWNGRVWEQTGLAVSWFDQVLGMSLIWVILVIIVFFPTGFTLIGRMAGRVMQNNQVGDAGKQ
jgi:hypothetical protein